MSAPKPSEVEHLIALARAAKPHELSSTDLRRLVRQSALKGSERRSRARQRNLLMLVGGLSCAVAALVLWKPWHDPKPMLAVAAPAVTWAPLELALPSGDRLAASPGAQFELEKSNPSARRFALRGGSVVFSVERLESGETFSVQTPHAYVEVRGTVFSVDVDAQRTRVRVHEGSVQVQGSRTVQTLHRGERYGSDGGPVPDLARPLELRASALVTERTSAAGTAPAVPALGPVVEPQQERDASIGPGSEPPLLLVPESQRFVTLEQARSLLQYGDAEGALAAVDALRPGAATRGEWLLLKGDALRSLGRAREAVDAYIRAAAILAPAPAAHAAFKAADLSLRVLDDPAATLRILDKTSLDAFGAPLRERALLLRVEASQRLGLPVRVLAQRYLTTYPDSAGAPAMRLLAGPAP